MAGALEGIKIVEIAQELQGPYAAQYLADMGASVIKIENRETGDLSRWLAMKNFFPDAPHGHVSPYFLAVNRGKRSLTLDLKKPEAKEILKKLIDQADVLLTNYRPGVLDRLGFSYEDCTKTNPKLIYAQGTSWGPKGPWTTRPSRDTLAQAAGGLIAKNGISGPPVATGAAIADANGALALAASVLAALFVRERTGEGQKCGASIYGAVLAMQPLELSYTGATGRETPRAHRAHQLLRGMWGAFPTKNGHICIAGCDDGRWPRFCKILGLEHLENDPECDNTTRNFHGEKIERILDETFPKKTTEEWLELLNGADILATKVQNYTDIMASEQARVNGYITKIPHHELGEVSLAGNPITLERTPVNPTKPAPEWGEHTEEILLEAGYDWEKIAELREKQVV
jgi:crotonobetainyl-CoA:carnitine CoA-transferase CaiB-like acyl-CoA transferase